MLAGGYPERDVSPESAADQVWLSATFWMHRAFKRRLPDGAGFALEVARRADRLANADLPGQVASIRYRVRRDGHTADLAAECFALHCVALQRTGTVAGFATATVLGAARSVLSGNIVEVAEPSDRLLALGLAAGAHALGGTPVHLLAASAPRARALAEALGPPLAECGIGVGLIEPQISDAERREAYSSLLVCGALRDVGVDYLRDRIALGGRARKVLGALDRIAGESSGNRLFLRGMRCAVIEGADEAMLDDWRMPLALSAESDVSGERLVYEQALELARALRSPDDFRAGAERMELTPEASRRLERVTQALGGVWANDAQREELIALALEAMHGLRSGRDYQVRERQVFFAAAQDEGEEPAAQLLRKLVEVKEGCRITGARVVLARLSVTRLLGKYLQLGGACADARGLDSEFWQLYRLKIVSAGPQKSISIGAQRVFASTEDKVRALVERVRTSGDCATVIAVRTQGAASALLEALGTAGIGAAVAHGRETGALARLHEAGAVVISLHPAERMVTRSGGTPPQLIVAELHDGARQMGNLARAYGAASYEIFCSLEDEALRAHLGERILAGAARALQGRAELGVQEAGRLVRRVLLSAERAFASARVEAHAQERNLDDLLAFSGQRE